MAGRLDRIDLKMLRLLQNNGRLSNAELAGMAGVSAATCHRRTQRLFEEGFIPEVRAVVAPRKVGKGATTYCAFLPALSAFRPAIPMRPVDRGSSDDAMAHFLPTSFDETAWQVTDAPLKDVTRPVLCDQPHVAARQAATPLWPPSWYRKRRWKQSRQLRRLQAHSS